MVYHTVFASPQLELIELDDVPWIKVQQRALQRRTPRRIILGEPLTWMGLETSAFIFLSLQVLGAVGRTCFPHVSCVMRLCWVTLCETISFYACFFKSTTQIIFCGRKEATRDC